jgi:hypothetical protein
MQQSGIVKLLHLLYYTMISCIHKNMGAVVSFTMGESEELHA